MSTVVVDVRDIAFTQSTVKAEFKDGGSLQQLIEDLKSGAVSMEDLPPIRVVQKEDGTLVSLDNRRLYALKEALKYKHQQNVEVEMVAKKECTAELHRKLTTCCDGKGIRVKDGEPNWAIRTGPRDGEYLFDKDQCKVYLSKLNKKQIAEIIEKDPNMLDEFAKRGMVSVEDAVQELENPGFPIEQIEAESSAGFRINKAGRPVDPKTSKFIKNEEAIKLGYCPAVAKAGVEEKRKQAEAEALLQCQQDEADQKRKHAEAEERRQRQQKVEDQRQRQQKVEQQRRQAEEEQRRQDERRCQQAEAERQRQQAEQMQRQQAEQRQRQQAEQMQRQQAEMQQQRQYHQPAEVPCHISNGSANGRELHTGPRGGSFYMNSKGKKTYV